MSKTIYKFEHWKNSNDMSLSGAASMARQISTMTGLDVRLIRKKVHRADDCIYAVYKICPKNCLPEEKLEWTKRSSLIILIMDKGDSVFSISLDGNLIYLGTKEKCLPVRDIGIGIDILMMKMKKKKLKED